MKMSIVWLTVYLLKIHNNLVKFIYTDKVNKSSKAFNYSDFLDAY